MWQWLMSKNCFLKNAWFWLLCLGIGAAIFFSGGLLLPLAAAIPLLTLGLRPRHPLLSNRRSILYSPLLILVR